MKKCYRWTIVGLLLFAGLSQSSAGASPCSGIERTIDASRKTQLAAPIAAQLKMGPVTVLGYMGQKNWSIIYVDPANADEAFLFFKGDPGKTHYVTLWSGAARIDEGRAINKWVLENAPRIPRKLAACFTWTVTEGDRPS